MKAAWSESDQTVSFVLALPIFPGRRQPSIVGRSELNFRVRDGNGWTLALISTNFSVTRTPVWNNLAPQYLILSSLDRASCQDILLLRRF